MCRSSPPPSSALLVSPPCSLWFPVQPVWRHGGTTGQAAPGAPQHCAWGPCVRWQRWWGFTRGWCRCHVGACGWWGAPHGLGGVLLCVLCTCGACSVCPWVGMWMGGSPAPCRFPAPLTQALLVPQQEHRRVCFGGAGEGPERAPAQRASAEPNLSCSPPAAARGLPDAQQAARLCGSHDLLPVYLNPVPD